MKHKLKQKIIFFFSILTCLGLVLGLLVGNIKAFSVGVFDSSNSSFDSSLSSSSASNSKSFYILDDPTCAIASKISVEMEEWPMNYYKNPELASKADIYYKARTSCDEIEFINKQLNLKTLSEFQKICPNSKSLYQQLTNNNDIYSKIIEEYYNQIIICSDQVSFIQEASSKSSNSYDPYKIYTDLEIQQACNKKDTLEPVLKLS